MYMRCLPRTASNSQIANIMMEVNNNLRVAQQRHDLFHNPDAVSIQSTEFDIPFPHVSYVNRLEESIKTLHGLAEGLSRVEYSFNESIIKLIRTVDKYTAGVNSSLTDSSQSVSASAQELLAGYEAS